MSDPIFRVTPGSIGVNSIHVLTRGPNFMVFSIDLKAKHAQLGPMSNQEITVHAGPETRDAEPGDDLTIIHLDNLPPGASVDATLSRYTLTVFVYVMDEAPPLVWEA
jgi:hypothetical protein